MPSSPRAGRSYDLRGLLDGGKYLRGFRFGAVILLVPRERRMPVVFVLCTVGAYAITSRVFDIHVMLAFGFLGFLLREFKFPMAPLILGLVRTS